MRKKERRMLTWNTTKMVKKKIDLQRKVTVKTKKTNNDYEEEGIQKRRNRRRGKKPRCMKRYCKKVVEEDEEVQISQKMNSVYGIA